MVLVCSYFKCFGVFPYIVLIKCLHRIVVFYGFNRATVPLYDSKLYVIVINKLTDMYFSITNSELCEMPTT